MIQAAARLPRCAGCTVARVTTPTAAKRIRTPVGGASAEPSAPNQARARYEMSRTASRARTTTPVVGREEAGIMHLPIGGEGIGHEGFGRGSRRPGSEPGIDAGRAPRVGG